MRYAWIAGLALIGLGPGGGQDERGMELFEQGQYAEAAAAFRAAIEADGPSAARSYNLALALWKAGDLDAAETAAEEAATLSNGELNPLRDGILGNLRYAAAEAKQAEDLQAALALAEQARAHFLRGAMAPGARPEQARNLERACKLIEELKKKIEEQEKQEQDKQDDENKDDENKDDEKKDDEKKDDQQKGDPEQDPKKDPEQDPQSSDEPSEQPPEPKPEDQKPEDQKPEDQKPDEQKKDPQEQPAPAPGEQQEGRELSPEEKKRLLDKLKEMDDLRLQLRERQKAQRPKVEKDW